MEVACDYDRIRQSTTRAAIQSRPRSIWRFRELLPVAGDPTIGLEVGDYRVLFDQCLWRRS